MCDDASRSATHSKPTSRKRCKVVNSIVTPASNPRKYRYQSLSPLPSASNNDTNSRSLDVEEIPKPSEEKLKKYMDILAAYKPELLKDRDPSLMLSDSHPQAGSSKAKPHHSHMSHHAQSSEHPHPLHRPGSSGYIQHHFDCSKPRPCDTNKSRSRGEEIQQELKWLKQSKKQVAMPSESEQDILRLYYDLHAIALILLLCGTSHVLSSSVASYVLDLLQT